MASRADVAAPSLYKHVRNLAELRALMLAWRDYVLRQPHRDSALDQAPEPMVVQAGEGLVDIMLAALHAYGFQRPEKLDETYDCWSTW